MADAPTTFGPKAVDQIAKTVREVSRRMMNETPHRGRWQNINGAKIKILDALVSECISNGFYLVELADMPEMTVPVDGDCDICSGDCDTSFTEPTRTLPIGNGNFVTAYDSRKLPQEIGGHCQIAWTGWREAGTGVSGRAEKIYSVIVPARSLESFNVEEWDCCDGVPTRIACQTFIGELIACYPEYSPCPSV